MTKTGLVVFGFELVNFHIFRDIVLDDIQVPIHIVNEEAEEVN